ncbi:MAG: T9SS type A sorting domain-containing protein [Candidatus Marinimicrobia bacterium]|nr:T9SS type A sorting domain-containing protein [Candidatus Neomarinimicrobiota bacterium]MBT4362242.1 T9SS type A sorting domain-containing protein [Candidatus Neomarinimicrobiota bacterium]MBT4714865.1 T9SS type A sorting domain-containing protein [Candidatus Neomarinimicrobiota bacterium]MBT4947311.1 T9SS type A sorting domain-containing protein [Candidatus Neomarinimicrobiota bacterium]MBT5269452.1 T9SS type A sorting domain-containing protein [Candidatus Neomarinimicrobiota bacterium]
MKALNTFISLALMTSMAFGQLFINEIDYDQPDQDPYEFIEIAGPAGTYSSVVIDFINGNNNTSYRTVDLGSITIADESNGYGFYVVGAATVSEADITPAGWPASHAIQNGDPDGVVLLINNNIVDAVSYEGEMTDTDGNVMEDGGTDFPSPDSSISRIGIDGTPWEHTGITPGAANTNQTFDPNVNFPPVANAGANQYVESGAIVSLDGSGSSDFDGTIASYLWEQVSGSSVTLTNATSAIASFTVPTVTETSTWVFSLTVTDDEGATASAETEVIVQISTILTIAEARTQALGTLVTTTGLVTSVNYYEGNGVDYTFQDETAALHIYRAGELLVLELGDEITVTGEISAPYDVIDIVPTSIDQIVINSTGNTLPEPQVITVAQLMTDGEDYESELIKILNLSTDGGDPWPTSGNNANMNIIDGGTGSAVMRIDKDTQIDGTVEPVWPVDVIGVVTQFQGTNQIQPRLVSDFLSNIVRPTFTNEIHTPEFATSANEITVTIDIVPGDETQSINSAVLMYGTGGTHLNESEMWLDNGSTYMGIIPAQAANSFLEYEIIATAFTTYDSGIDTSEFDSWTYELAIASSEVATIASIQANPIQDQIVTVEGIVTIGGDLLQPPYTKAYLQDASGRGINLFQFDELDINRGDMITVVGAIEIFQTTVEITDFSYQLISTGNDLPAPVVLTPGEANNAEYEGTWLKITGTITDTWSAGGGQNVLIGDGSDTCVVRIWETTGVDVTPLTVGTEWSFLGVESQYNNTFQLLVAYDADIISTSAIDVIDTKPSQFALNPAYPNPFNPSTTLSWKLESSSDMMLRVMDVRGREVARLVEGSTGPGQFSMTWDASDLSSGVYFIQLITPNESAIQKVMLLK